MKYEVVVDGIKSFCKVKIDNISLSELARLSQKPTMSNRASFEKSIGVLYDELSENWLQKYLLNKLAFSMDVLRKVLS